ncbi:MAG: hypothetical protein UU32_C0010G0009 [Candidatus Woesebacteria bacterium GW2011_GWB1_41_10]|uniref:Uncharacterized protein n=1 Tax=Candidatus Woesebacteria bacterium GW2011_GWB1_41_10 TaxID=1618577 RepID=A0A0G0UH39_9BACT|nr:MAG: hypothetical protein UU32_C0010G0009 [Candidatus Woesebacteria bacterium GW2011_GWB1_41_10]
MKKVLLFLISLFFLALLGYVVLPEPGFPAPPADALQSKEPADSESPLRRAYFTNFTREEVMSHYKKEFKWGLNLNYPPEESRTIIRDQTRSTFLEEIVHPLRESVFINGFEPKVEKDAINIEGLSWRQKIIVKLVPSNIFVRIAVVILSYVGSVILIKEWLKK